MYKFHHFCEAYYRKVQKNFLYQKYENLTNAANKSTSCHIMNNYHTNYEDVSLITMVHCTTP